ncbi:hypothetical protein ACFY83_34745 [Streptomyces althioticus]|uniref:hypothetical protein n=1 Tax=Streptomyces althioticus TaxID=83380 RepID=UPI0036E76AD5
MKPHTRRLVLTAVGVAAALAYILLLWRGPWWVDGPHLRKSGLQPADGVVITGFRTTLVALGAGAVAALGLFYTHRTHRHAEKLYEHSQEQFAHAREKDREQVTLTREGQVTERYVEAIKLLGSGNLHERLGGIYSLERITRSASPKAASPSPTEPGRQGLAALPPAGAGLREPCTVPAPRSPVVRVEAGGSFTGVDVHEVVVRSRSGRRRRSP